MNCPAGICLNSDECYVNLSKREQLEVNIVKREKILDETAGTLKSIFQEPDEHDDRIEWDEEEASIVGDTLAGLPETRLSAYVLSVVLGANCSVRLRPFGVKIKWTDRTPLTTVALVCHHVEIVAVFFEGAQSIALAFAETWCGKNYKSSLPDYYPRRKLPCPCSVKDLLHPFRCSPAIPPCLGDVSTAASMLIDSPVVYYRFPEAKVWTPPDELDVTISLNRKTLANAMVLPNTTAYESSFSLVDYYWADYTAGTDIVLHDVYMVANNVTLNKWHTACTPDYGVCGYDNCTSIPAGDSATVSLIQ
ncbi:hypothetical protein V8B97DRAFT_1920888 [Scleroderma yunnanense]